MSKLLIIDTETGGLDPITHSILSLGVVVLNDKEIEDATEWLIIEPTIHVTVDAMAINKISLDQLAQYGKLAETVVQELEDWLSFYFGSDKITLGGQNTYFDAGFLKRLYMFAPKYSFNNRYSYRLIDTASLAWFLISTGKLQVENYSLTTLFKHFNLEPPVAHTALGDAFATANLLIKLKELV